MRPAALSGFCCRESRDARAHEHGAVQSPSPQEVQNACLKYLAGLCRCITCCQAPTNSGLLADPAELGVPPFELLP
jgi:hypothetical protein